MANRLKRGLTALAVALLTATGLAVSTPASAAGDAFTPPPPIPKASKADRTSPKAKSPGVKGHPDLRPQLAAGQRKLLAGPYYFYGVAQQTHTTGTTDGVMANLVTAKPWVDSAVKDDHSLAEVSIQDTATGHAVEIGYTVDPGTFGDSNPRLFVYHWVLGVPQGYGAGFTDNAANPINHGSLLPYPLQKSFFIQRSGGDWWVGYDTAWVGRFAGANFTGGFTSGTETSGFGEVATKPGTSHTTSCSDMGHNGELGYATNVNATRVGSAGVHDITTNAWVNGVQTVWVASTGTAVPATGVYEANPSVTPPNPPTNRTMRYGGPGWNSAGTAAGTANAC